MIPSVIKTLRAYTPPLKDSACSQVVQDKSNISAHEIRNTAWVRGLPDFVLIIGEDKHPTKTPVRDIKVADIRLSRKEGPPRGRTAHKREIRV